MTPTGCTSRWSALRPLIAAAWTACAVLSTAGGSVAQSPAGPPKAPVRPVTTDYYGTKVVDPYRYMENLKDPKVQAWLKAENDYTRAVLARIPGREELLQRWRQLDRTVPQVRVTRLPGGRYLVLKSLPGDNTPKLYLRQGLHGPDRLLVDPGKVELAPGDRGKGKNVISGFAVSQDGRYVAVDITPGGSRPNSEIHVTKTASGRETGDVILHAGYMEWLPDSRSFIYDRRQRIPPGAHVSERRQPAGVYLHALGRDTARDPAVFGYGVVPGIKVDPRYNVFIGRPSGSGYAVAAINGLSPNSAFYIERTSDLGKTNSAWHEVADLSDDVGATLSPGPTILTRAVAIHGDDLYLLTYKDAPRFKVIRTSASKPDLASAETVVPQGRAVITSIHGARDALYVQLLDGGIGRVLRVPYGPKPAVQEITLPFEGTVNVKTDPRVPGALLGMQSWTRAHRIYAYDPGTNRIVDTGFQPAGPNDNPSGVTSVEVKVPSYDGTLVPLSIVYPQDMRLNGSNPTLLVGYGAYGISVRPSFDPARIGTWTARGGVYAVCHVRGGGEYGESWHLAGKGSTKPNTWRDFIACAQYLIAKKYTSPARLAGLGVSAGGITIGRAITERPDLFAAAIDEFGKSDALRAETMPNGPGNIPEFGSTKTKAGFEALYAMSAYAHVKAGTPYPAVLLMTGMNDPAVAPWQMAKMTARLQAATSSGKPVLLRVDYSGGHSYLGATRAQNEERRVDMFSFLLWQLGVKGFQPGG